MTLQRIAIRVAHAEVEIARVHLLEIAPSGLEEIDGETSTTLVAYGDNAVLGDVRAAFPDAVSTPVRPGWEDAWRAFHRPVVVGGIWIGPPWLEPPPGAPAVVIDPGRAFGTGAHATTRLCIELLTGLERGSLLDVGCGSGVLSIAAVRLGYRPVLAVDDDPVAVEVTLANVAANGVEVETRELDATAQPLPPSDVTVANVTLEVAAHVLAATSSGSAVTAGYLDTERPHAPGWESVDRRETGGWAADTFVRR